MSEAKTFLENESNNTYGIEIEFGTHDNQMLSFTHIEVCHFFIEGTPNEDGWKIETDADYTLELVSPILKFESQEAAREFRDELMDYLESRVRSGVLLGALMEMLMRYIAPQFTYARGIWTYRPSLQKLELKVEWISSREMYESLTWKNWDEDTDLERVLAARKIIEEEIDRNEDQADLIMQVRMENVIVTKSRKHGGLPSSQLNLPLELWAFVYYQTHYKRAKAWNRLLEVNTSSPDYIARKIHSTLETYPDLRNNPVWMAKYANTDYVESQIDQKTSFWQRYWLWLETFFICAGHLSKEVGWNNYGRIREYVAAVDAIVDSNVYSSVHQAQDKLNELKTKTDETFNINYRTNRAADLMYLVVYKLVAGALSELSETLQMKAQEKIMDLRGDMNMDQIRESIPNNQFMQFHYAVKDLTSLWFKSPLMDVMNAEIDASVERKSAVENIINKLKLAQPNYISDVITMIFTANFKLLGWYHSVCEANNQGFDYDWEEFSSYNMPGIPAFQNSVLRSAEYLNRFFNRLDNPPPELFVTTSQLPHQYVVFLKRKYEKDEGKQGTPKGSIAPWEGRWDTMKPAIRTTPAAPKYLIEHRNN